MAEYLYLGQKIMFAGFKNMDVKVEKNNFNRPSILLSVISDISFSKTFLPVARSSSRESFSSFLTCSQENRFSGFLFVCLFFTIFSYSSAIKKFQCFPVVSEFKKKKNFFM